MSEENEERGLAVLAILKHRLETSLHYEQVASKIGNPEGYSYVAIPEWELRQIVEFLESQAKHERTH